MTRYLVTGGAGFIGSHIARRLLDEGHWVRVIDDLSSGKLSNLPTHDRLEFLKGDIRDIDKCRAAVDDVEIIFHEAARPSVPLSVENPERSHDVNVNGTFNILDAARLAGVRRVVYAASSSAYGETVESVKHEGIVPQPLSPYAVNKLLGEHYLRAYAHCYGMETISLRYFNVFGPRQDPKSQYAAAIPAFVTAILKGESPKVYGDGEQTRDFTFIDNVVHGNMLAANAPKVNGEVINVACGERVSVNQVIARVNAELGKSIKSNHVAERAGDVKHSLADVSKAKELIGYEPIVKFDEGLRRAITWYSENLV